MRQRSSERQPCLLCELLTVKPNAELLHWTLGAFTSLVIQTVKNLPAMWETWVWYLGWEDPLEKGIWLTTPVFLPGEFHGQRSLAGYNPWGPKELDRTEKLSLSLWEFSVTLNLILIFWYNLLTKNRIAMLLHGGHLWTSSFVHFLSTLIIYKEIDKLIPLGLFVSVQVIYH